MKVAIHQPNFFPWIGLFHRISLVDRFVFFDHVQALRGKSWLSRNYIKVNGEKKLLTMPIKRRGNNGLIAVNEVEINYGDNFRKRHLRTLELAYSKAKYFEETIGFVSAIYDNNYATLCDFNKSYIEGLIRRIGYNTELLSSTDIVSHNEYLKKLSGNDLVLNLCLQVGAKQYISGDGCTDFIKPDTFLDREIHFQFQNFIHPAYNQLGTEFISHLSSLDVLFNIGFDGIRELIKTIK